MKKLIIIILVGILCGCSAQTLKPSQEKPPVDKPVTPAAANNKEIMVNEYIRQLGADDWQTRDNAQTKLEEIGEAAEPFLKKAQESIDAEIRNRAKDLLYIFAFKQVKFSDGFLKEFPHVHLDLLRFTAQKKFAFLHEIIDRNKNVNVTNHDLALLIDGIFIEKGYQKLTGHEKCFIAGVIRGIYFESDPMGWTSSVSWWKPIPESAPHLIEFLEDNDYKVRLQAIESLGEFNLSTAHMPLIRLLKDDVLDVRAKAAQVLGKIGASEALPFLCELLKDEAEEVQFKATRSMAQLGVNEIIPDLRKLLTNKNTLTCSNAIYLLAQANDKKIIPDLMTLLNDKKEASDICASIAYAFGKLGVNDIVPELIKLINHKHNVVRLNAVNALAKLKAKESIPQIIPLFKIKDYDPNLYANISSDMVYPWAAVALVELGAKDQVPKEIIPYLQEKLRNHWSIYPDTVNEWVEDNERICAVLKELGITGENQK
jgi:HEAT repeat protein